MPELRIVADCEYLAFRSELVTSHKFGPQATCNSETETSSKKDLEEAKNKQHEKFADPANFSEHEESHSEASPRPCERESPYLSPHVNAADLNSYATSLDSHATDIDSHATNLESYATDIDSCVTDRDTYATSLDSHAIDPDSRATDLDSYATNLGLHATNIDSYATDLDSHATDLDSDATNLDSHATNLDSHATTTEYTSSSSEETCSICSTCDVPSLADTTFASESDSHLQVVILTKFHFHAFL